jgi:hypothetical protein
MDVATPKVLKAFVLHTYSGSAHMLVNVYLNVFDMIYLSAASDRPEKKNIEKKIGLMK